MDAQSLIVSQWSHNLVLRPRHWAWSHSLKNPLGFETETNAPELRLRRDWVFSLIETMATVPHGVSKVSKPTSGTTMARALGCLDLRTASDAPNGHRDALNHPLRPDLTPNREAL